MKENFCFDCEHVWVDPGKATVCPVCGGEHFDSDDYDEGYEDHNSEYANDIHTQEH